MRRSRAVPSGVDMMLLSICAICMVLPAAASPAAWRSLCGQDGDDLVLQQLHFGGALCCDVIGLLEGITPLIAVTELIYIK